MPHSCLNLHTSRGRWGWLAASTKTSCTSLGSHQEAGAGLERRLLPVLMLYSPCSSGFLLFAVICTKSQIHFLSAGAALPFPSLQLILSDAGLWEKLGGSEESTQPPPAAPTTNLGENPFHFVSAGNRSGLKCWKYYRP